MRDGAPAKTLPVVREAALTLLRNEVVFPAMRADFFCFYIFFFKSEQATEISGYAARFIRAR